MQDKHIVKIKKHPTPTKNPKNQNTTNFSKAEIISSHTATISNTETFPKWIKDLKTKHKIFYSTKTRKYKVMWMEASKYSLETLLSDAEICPEFLALLFQDVIYHIAKYKSLKYTRSWVTEKLDYIWKWEQTFATYWVFRNFKAEQDRDARWRVKMSAVICLLYNGLVDNDPILLV